MKFCELFINDDGKLSRTQVNMWVAHLTALIIVILEAALGGIITTPLVIVLCLYTISSHADRMDTRRFQFRLGKDGAEVNLHGPQEQNHG